MDTLFKGIQTSAGMFLQSHTHLRVFYTSISHINNPYRITLNIYIDTKIWININIDIELREEVKYYFADFVLKVGTLPPPLRTKILQTKS